ncbi:myelin-oligodendrocyte glycoprotein-like [Haplochromis burtoni]|uniref:myelin-oligodendrocyte glycoprotein-like n=1 Tax=Haplochromis burtoni TaxID=8153 RepID=UPI001C2DE4EE|nr:myelin-oligodendrocyte glycoprotein-like [Haplochromis burtoni]XP_042073488.1 myelin-oligodendrocyte glycoprotein-like [Haplochromis burtoni]
MESLIVFLFVISCSVALQQDVQAKFGEDVTLQCQITTDERISVVKWSRPDLNTDGYVYFYRNKRFYENYQHPSFHGRVKLRDPEMKDGDVSVILKNVTFNDTGMYECHIAVRNPVRSKRAHTEISHFIDLTVTGETDEKLLQHQIVESEAGNIQDVGDVVTPTLIMGVCYVVVAFIVVGFLTLFIFKRIQLKGLKVTVPDNALL